MNPYISHKGTEKIRNLRKTAVRGVSGIDGVGEKGVKWYLNRRYVC